MQRDGSLKIIFTYSLHQNYAETSQNKSARNFFFGRARAQSSGIGSGRALTFLVGHKGQSGARSCPNMYAWYLIATTNPSMKNLTNFWGSGEKNYTHFALFEIKLK